MASAISIPVMRDAITGLMLAREAGPTRHEKTKITGRYIDPCRLLFLTMKYYGVVLTRILIIPLNFGIFSNIHDNFRA
jgi:hypothetical protein